MNQPIYQVKADFLKALAHPVRIRVLELLAEGEKSVGELAKDVEAEPSHLSQQLGVLRSRGVVSARRVGSNVHYSAKDPRIFELLRVAKEILTTSLQENNDLLADLATVSFTEAGSRKRRPARSA